MSDPNNDQGNPIPTNINAFYADLATAENELKLAQGKIDGLKEQIVAMGGTLPGDSADGENVVVAGDEAQLKQDEAADVAADANEPVEADAPVEPVPAPEPPTAPEVPVPEEESPAEEAAESAEEPTDAPATDQPTA